eukprot:scaffold9346_cov67-Attheya_sp.AAC.5
MGCVGLSDIQASVCLVIASLVSRLPTIGGLARNEYGRPLAPVHRTNLIKTADTNLWDTFEEC